MKSKGEKERTIGQAKSMYHGVKAITSNALENTYIHAYIQIHILCEEYYYNILSGKKLLLSRWQIAVWFTFWWGPLWLWRVDFVGEKMDFGEILSWTLLWFFMMVMIVVIANLGLVCGIVWRKLWWSWWASARQHVMPGECYSESDATMHWFQWLFKIIFEEVNPRTHEHPSPPSVPLAPPRREGVVVDGFPPPLPLPLPSESGNVVLS